MRCGLYGKLPAKRDFVAVSAPRRFVRVWESWIEQGMAESRACVREDEWKRAFSSAPIWRFWLGPALCDEAVTGAFMPSMDTLGRLFPLTLIGVAGKGEALSSPDVDRRDSWFEGVERFLRSTRDGHASFETTLEALGDLGASLAQAEASRQGDTRVTFRAAVVGGGLFSLARNFAALRGKRNNSLPAKATYWWTLGGDGREALAWTQDSMPDPAVFGDMMTRGFENRPEACARPE
ncbi:MAG TPA: type VI secretion system-associated protein TagF [Methylocella sp.]